MFLSFLNSYSGLVKKASVQSFLAARKLGRKQKLGGGQEWREESSLFSPPPPLILFAFASISAPKIRDRLLPRLHESWTHTQDTLSLTSFVSERERERGRLLRMERGVSCLLPTLFSDFLLKNEIQTPVDHIVNLITVFFDVPRVPRVRGFLIRMTKIYLVQITRYHNTVKVLCTFNFFGRVFMPKKFVCLKTRIEREGNSF